MATPPVPDDLWEAAAPLLPPEPPRPKGSRPRVSDRAALDGILFVLHTRLRLELAAAGVGLRQRGDLLAAAAGRAAHQRLGRPPPRPARPPQCRRRDRLCPRLARFGERAN